MAEAVGAWRDGAHRLELCVALETGGLTPPADLVTEVKAAVPVPVFAMARPEVGGFILDAAATARTLRDVEAVLAAGADGVVVGFLAPDGRVDVGAVADAVRLASGAPVTFHRAFDHAVDRDEGLEALVGAGVRRVLTGGGPGPARTHADALAGLVRAADDRIGILAGGGVRGDHVRHLVAFTGVREVHARAEGVAGVCRALS